MIKNLTKSLNRDFLGRIFSITIPVTLQNLMGSSRNLVDTMMIGTLGVSSVAAVGAAGKPYFVLMLLIFGITNGSGILIAQYWGKKDDRGVARSVLLTLTLSVSISSIIVILVKIFTPVIIGWTSKDVDVLRLGSEYMRIIIPNLIFQAITLSMNVGLRSTGQVKKCTYTSLIGVTSNIFLNYILIFGKFGLPALGLRGAALGTFYSCMLEMFIIVLFTITNKKFSLSIRRFVKNVTIDDVRRLLKISLPLAFGSFAWAGGTYIYYIIYGRLGSGELAIMTMLEPLVNIMVAFFTGLATGSGVIIGHALGREEYDTAWSESLAVIFIGFIIGIVVFSSVILLRDIYLGFFSSLPDTTLLLARGVYLFVMLKIVFMAYNIVVIVGILRAGGDTRHILFIDMFGQWAVGIPLGLIAAFVLKLPLQIVVLVVASEEIVKVFLTTKRLRSRKWIRNVVN